MSSKMDYWRLRATDKNQHRGSGIADMRVEIGESPWWWQIFLGNSISGVQPTFNKN
ncbi:hypothetical protein [Microcoleus sp. N3A4]|uniref:hypothetical protein n=1 Tax=Microcoleus sp. N3A4 TaxID=3055379 RepID=UPI002FD659DB